MRTFLKIAAIAASCLAIGSPAAFAQNTELAPVQVTGSKLVPPRVDVSHTCPDYGETLRTSLARTLRYEDRRADMRVVFTLKGNQVDSVDTSGGPFEYRSPVRRAVRHFVCSNDGQANQSFAFEIAFRPDDGGVAMTATATAAPAQTIALGR